MKLWTQMWNKLPEIHSNWNQQCSAYGVVDITICWCCFDIQSSCFGWCVIVLHGSSNMYGGKCYHHHFDPLIPINLFPALLWLDTMYTMGWNNFYSKGQLISKGLFGILEFFRKTNEGIRSFIFWKNRCLERNITTLSNL